ncbi:MAG: GNAT family N-acetyltransferase [Blastocatellia bacterium]|nr:GNAT family N-acetyltransferase [Blastocatellia bacterium]
MKPIRPFKRDDIPQVSALHQRIFGVNGAPSRSAATPAEAQVYADYFEGTFLQNPWYDDALPSLVSEDSTGRIAGFLGILPRRMTIAGRPIRVAISSQFIVDPETRSLGTGLGLVKAFLSGPQDLSMTDEANETSRRLWEGFKGLTAPLYSIHWTRMLRPARHAASLLGAVLGRGSLLSTLVTTTTGPACNLADAIAARKLPNHFSVPEPKTEAEALTPESLLACLAEFSNTRALWPEYDAKSLSWLLETIGRKKLSGELRAFAVRRAGGALLGWYVYLLKAGGESNLLQMMGRKGTIGDVVDHLFYDAWRHGSLSVTGRMDTQFIHIYAEKRCTLRCGTPWFLFQSNQADLVDCIQRGDALLSKLEGEWCLHFR